jgi:hypothetical protein
VLLFNVSSGKDPNGMITAIRESLRRFRAGGYEIVPLGDICEFVREHRYVPKKCMGVVIETADMPELEAVVEALGETRLALLLPPEALVGDWRQLAESEIPAGVSLGVSFKSSTQPEDAGGLLDLLKDLGARSTAAGGHDLRYVRLKETGAIELRGLLRDTPYRCFLDGKGFNRFGDEPDMLRLIDTSAIMASRRVGANLSLYVDLFKGRYYVWPVVALLRLSGAGPGAT